MLFGSDSPHPDEPLIQRYQRSRAAQAALPKPHAYRRHNPAPLGHLVTDRDVVPACQRLPITCGNCASYGWSNPQERSCRFSMTHLVTPRGRPGRALAEGRYPKVWSPGEARDRSGQVHRCGPVPTREGASRSASGTPGGGHLEVLVIVLVAAAVPGRSP